MSIRKVVAVVIIAAISLAIASSDDMADAVPEDSGLSNDGLAWTYESGVLTFSGASEIPSEGDWDKYSGTVTEVVIGDDVEAIGSYAFQEFKMGSISLGDGVKTIGDSAFQKCTNLKSVELPNSAVRIGNNAFAHCLKLESVKLNEGLETIGSFAFKNCIDLSSINLPRSLQSVNEAFAGCISLTSIEIPDVDVNLSGTFAESGLRTVTVPANVTLSHGTFQDCTYLESAVVQAHRIDSYANEVFQGCTALKTVSVANSSMIVDKMFDGCTSLTDVQMSEDIIRIDNYAFRGCTSLESIEFPSSLRSIGYEAFRGCTSLESIELPEGFLDMNTSVFDDCTSLRTVIIPSTMEETNNSGLFRRCTSLESIDVASGNEFYSSVDGIMYNASKTEIIMIPVAYAGEVVLPDSVTTLEGSPFSGCSKITGIDIPDSVKELDTYAFYQCYALEEISLPDGLNSIPQYAFLDCISLETIRIPNTVTSIAEYSFCGCTSLSAFDIPTSVENIYEGTFAGCIGLERITIPDNVFMIDTDAFDSCTNLKEIVITGDTIITGDGLGLEDRYGKECRVYIYSNGGQYSGTSKTTVVNLPLSEFDSFRHVVSVSTDSVHGDVTADVEFAHPGDVVMLEVSSDSGYEVEAITCTTIDGGTVDVNVSGDGYSFIMPSRNVMIAVDFTGTDVVDPEPTPTPDEPKPDDDGGNTALYAGAAAAVVIVGLLAIFVLRSRRP